MGAVLFIALRYLRKRKRQNFLLFLAITFGVASLIGTSALLGGWGDVLLNKTVNLSVGHIVIFPPPGEEFLSDYEHVLAEVRGVEGVRAASPRLEIECIAICGERARGLLAIGVEPESISDVLSIGDYVDEGRFLSKGDEQAVVLGSALAEELGASLGSEITVMAPSGRNISVSVVGILDTGLHELDTTAFYIPFESATALLGCDVATSIVVKLDDYNRAEEVAEKLRGDLGLNAKSWQELARPVLEALRTESFYMTVICSLILAVGALGILNVLYMAVAEKTRDIGILKALGLTNRQVSAIFLLVGIIIALLGAVIGCVVGTALAWQFSSIELPEEIYGMRHIPSRLDPAFYAYSFALALTIAVLASALPAKKAAKLDPVEALRHVL